MVGIGMDGYFFPLILSLSALAARVQVLVEAGLSRRC
jgi:hypothetical protein